VSRPAHLRESAVFRKRGLPLAALLKRTIVDDHYPLSLRIRALGIGEAVA
jgi:hypothetical protein